MKEEDDEYAEDFDDEYNDDFEGSIYTLYRSINPYLQISSLANPLKPVNLVNLNLGKRFKPYLPCPGQ